MSESAPQPVALHGAVVVNGALVICEDFDREPCPHQPERRCGDCPGRAHQPAPAAQTEQPAQKDAIDRAFDEGYAAGKASTLPHLSRLNDELAAVVSVYAARVAAEQPARGLVTEADSAVLEALGTITLWLELNDGVAQLGWIASVEEPHTEPPDLMHGEADLDDVLVEFRQNHGLDGLAELEQLFLRGISKAREISL